MPVKHSGTEFTLKERASLNEGFFTLDMHLYFGTVVSWGLKILYKLLSLIACQPAMEGRGVGERNKIERDKEKGKRAKR